MTREPSDAINTDWRSDHEFNTTLQGVLELPYLSLLLLKYLFIDSSTIMPPQDDLQSSLTFHQFPKLSPELRLMIWERTWPTSRVIEGAICEDNTAEEYADVAILRFAGPLSLLLEGDFGTRIIEGKPLERCPPLMALQVCRESRSHTLSQYRIIEHKRSRQGSFYFNPYRDVLWLSFDFTDEPEYLRDLQHCYGEQLNAIETLLVEEIEWNNSTPAGYTFNYLVPFTGLKFILVLFSDNDEDTDEDAVYEDAVDEDNGGESGGESGGDNIEDNNELESEARELLERADELRAEYTEFLKVCKQTAKTIRCMDRSGTFH